MAARATADPAVLCAQPVFYHPDQDKNPQRAATSAKAIANGALFSKESQNLDVLSKMEIQRVFSFAQVQTQAHIQALDKWSALYARLGAIKTKLQSDGAMPTDAQVEAQKTEVAAKVTELKAAIEKLQRVTSDSDTLRQLQDDLNTADDVLKNAQNLPINTKFKSAISNIQNGLDTASALYDSFVTAFEARHKVQQEADKIAAHEATEQQRLMLRLLAAEQDHLNWLSQNLARQAMEAGVLLTLIDATRTRMEKLGLDTSPAIIETDLENIAEAARTAADQNARHVQRSNLQIRLIILYDVAAIEAQGTLPKDLGDLRAAQEENRFSIQQSGAQMAGAETHLQNMVSLLAFYYQGGIKTTQIAQLLYNLSGLVSLPVIAAKKYDKSHERNMDDYPSCGGCRLQPGRPRSVATREERRCKKRLCRREEAALQKKRYRLQLDRSHTPVFGRLP